MTTAWIAAASAAVVALMSAFLTYNTTRRLSNRSDQISFVGRQLSELYGPLQALSKASETSWAEFRKKYYHDDVVLDEDTKILWKYWITNVFMPINRKMLDAILLHADLIEGIEMPLCFAQFCAHVTGYEVTLARWQDGDDSIMRSVIDHPGDSLSSHISWKYETLKKRQAALLSGRGRKKLE